MVHLLNYMINGGTQSVPALYNVDTAYKLFYQRKSEGVLDQPPSKEVKQTFVFTMSVISEQLCA